MDISRRLFMGLLGGLGVTALVEGPPAFLQRALEVPLPKCWAKLNGLLLGDFLIDVEVTLDQPMREYEHEGRLVYVPDGPRETHFTMTFNWLRSQQALHDILWEAMSSPVTLEVGVEQHRWESSVIARDYFWIGKPGMDEGRATFMSTGLVKYSS